MICYIKIAVLSLVALIMIEPTLQGAVMRLSSDAFAHNEAIPKKYTCQGDNISPQLKWNRRPEGTSVYALIMEDYDAKGRNGNAFVHWVIANLKDSELPEGVNLSDLEDIVVGVNDMGHTNYDGPCPPRGSGVHRYYFTIYALSKKVQLRPGVTATNLRATIAPYILEETTLVGTYRRA